MEGKAKVRSTGQLLSETDTGVDYLGESVYAEAIANSIHRAKTSITIGIYGKWGSGKSFLLRHVESILKRYQKQYVVDGGSDEGPITTLNSCSKARKLFVWILFLAVIFALITVSLVLAVDPSVLAPLPPEIATPEVQSGAPGTQTTSSIDYADLATTASPLEQYQSHLNTLRIVGLILIPVELLTLFIIGCFGRTWASKRHYGGFHLLMYGAFTRLPLQSSEKEIVEDPGQAPANVLRYAPKGSEGLAMAASQNAEFPRKYIFVDFKAWEYAGSDSLWAAIVTKISDAIETEFGAISTRLFRMLTIKEVNKKKLGETKKSLYIQFDSDATTDSIKCMMNRYGVIHSMERLCNVKGDEGFQWWMIRYASDGEYRHAKESLKIAEVSFQTYDPAQKHADQTLKRASKGRRSSRPLVPEEIPLENIGTDDESDEDDDVDVPAVQVDILSKICCCCDRFCFHFVRHPVMQWRLPRLFWWIILPVCCVLIPVTAYVTASAFNLDVEQTYRAVPMFGQVLLWLPASAAVALAVSKFAWAMCHSQRQRINQALDGTQGRMASQLGFMSKVKSEIQVMTNLIRCARFIQQRDYKVIIAIDDLDRLDVKKVHSVLESINILLSDKSSPFMCLIAADPRIVIKCVEESIGSPMREAKITGREYMKKIINLPVCLPEIKDVDKRRYVAGLIDQSDRTVNFRIKEQKNMRGTEAGGPNFRNYAADVPDSRSQAISHQEFLFECRRFLYENEDLHRHLHGNPRHIKRIFNVVSMTAFVIDCMVKNQERQDFIRTKVKSRCAQTPVVQGQERIVRTKKLAEDLVLWIALVDQWPYRTSFIIQRIEDSDQRVAAGWKKEEIPDDRSIVDIYTDKVLDNLEDPGSYLMTLDDDPDLFQTYLQLLEDRGFTKQDVVSLLKLTINLDYSIRRTIAFSLKPPPLSKLRPGDVILREAGDVLTDTESEHSAPSEKSFHADVALEEIPETDC